MTRVLFPRCRDQKKEKKNKIPNFDINVGVTCGAPTRRDTYGYFLFFLGSINTSPQSVIGLKILQRGFVTFAPTPPQTAAMCSRVENVRRSNTGPHRRTFGGVRVTECGGEGWPAGGGRGGRGGGRGGKVLFRQAQPKCHFSAFTGAPETRRRTDRRRRRRRVCTKCSDSRREGPAAVPLQSDSGPDRSTSGPTRVQTGLNRVQAGLTQVQFGSNSASDWSKSGPTLVQLGSDFPSSSH